MKDTITKMRGVTQFNEIEYSLFDNTCNNLGKLIVSIDSDPT